MAQTIILLLLLIFFFLIQEIEELRENKTVKKSISPSLNV